MVLWGWWVTLFTQKVLNFYVYRDTRFTCIDTFAIWGGPPCWEVSCFFISGTFVRGASLWYSSSSTCTYVFLEYSPQEFVWLLLESTWAQDKLCVFRSVSSPSVSSQSTTDIRLVTSIKKKKKDTKQSATRSKHAGTANSWISASVLFFPTQAKISSNKYIVICLLISFIELFIDLNYLSAWDPACKSWCLATIDWTDRGFWHKSCAWRILFW